MAWGGGSAPRGLVARASKRVDPGGLKGVTGETKRVKRDKRRDEDARGKCTSEKEEVEEKEEGGISERVEGINGRERARVEWTEMESGVR